MEFFNGMGNQSDWAIEGYAIVLFFDTTWWRASTRSTVSFEYQYKFFSVSWLLFQSLFSVFRSFCELATGTKNSAEMLHNSCQLFLQMAMKENKKRANDVNHGRPFSTLLSFLVRSELCSLRLRWFRLNEWSLSSVRWQSRWVGGMTLYMGGGGGSVCLFMTMLISLPSLISHLNGSRLKWCGWQ